MVIENGFTVCFEYRLGGHCGRWYIKCNYAESAFAYLIVTEISVGFTHICCRCSRLELYSNLGIGIFSKGRLVNLEEQRVCKMLQLCVALGIEDFARDSLLVRKLLSGARAKSQKLAVE